MFFRFRQIMHDPFPNQMPRQSLASAPLLLLRLIRPLPALRTAIDVIVVVIFIALAGRILRLPGRLKQPQLFFRQLLAFTAALRLQQLTQQALIFVLFDQRAVQLLSQIHHDLPQRVCILRQIFRIEGH